MPQLVALQVAAEAEEILRAAQGEGVGRSGGDGGVVGVFAVAAVPDLEVGKFGVRKIGQSLGSRPMAGWSGRRGIRAIRGWQ